jgi:hypothetical protein
MPITADQFNQGPTVLEQLQGDLQRKTAALPPDKKVVTVVAVDWVAGMPVYARWGTAVRVGDSFELGAEAKTKFTKASTSASLYVMWSK